MKKSITLILSFFTLLAISQQPDFIENELDAYAKDAINKWDIPGMSVCIVKDGKVVYMKGFGVKEAGSNGSVDKNTIFMIGSNSKAFTGTALAKLEYDKLCTLEDPVINWYPNFKMKDDWVTQHATLTDIVTHRLGMKTFQGDFMYWGSDLTEYKIIEKMGELTPEYDFRTKWGYCNAGYVLAGKCIEKISGQKWQSYLNNNFFNPLEMNRTYCYVSGLENVSNIARAHTLIDGKIKSIPFGEIDNLAPAGAIASSTEDMSHWLLMQLNDGKYNGEQVLPREVIMRTRKPESIVGNAFSPFNRANFELYGLGWGLQDYEGRKIVSHTGGIDGFVTSVTMIPEENLGILVFTNTDHNILYEALKWDIIDSYLDLPKRGYSDLYLNYYQKKTEEENKAIEAKRDTVAMKNPTTLDLDLYEGVYVHDIYGEIELNSKGKYLNATFENHPFLTAKLEPLGANRFLCTYSNELYGVKVFPFVTEGENVVRFTLSVADFLEYTTYDFIKSE